MNSLEKETFVDLDDFTQATTAAIVAYVLLQRKKYLDEVGVGSGTRTVLAGFNLDRTITDALERRQSDIRRKFELIAKKAEKEILSSYGQKIDYTSFVDKAVNGFIFQLREYLRYDNPQIKVLRDYLAGSIDAVKDVSFVAPVSFSRDVLATIGGASVDPQTSKPLVDSQGNYVVGLSVGLGLLYTGVKAIEVFSSDYESLNGYRPNLKYLWTHTTPPERALLEHQALGGKTFTAQTAAQTLANTTQPFIGPYFYPGDHWHCRCFVSVIAE